MRSVLLEQLQLGPNDLQPIVVWMDMLPADNWEAAQQAAQIFSGYPYVPQFHDPGRLAGGAVAASLGASPKTAWDIYLYYAPGGRWGRRAPSPKDWVHQMSDGGWAGAGKYHAGEALYGALKMLFIGL